MYLMTSLVGVSVEDVAGHRQIEVARLARRAGDAAHAPRAESGMSGARTLPPYPPFISTRSR